MIDLLAFPLVLSTTRGRNLLQYYGALRKATGTALLHPSVQDESEWICDECNERVP